MAPAAAAPPALSAEHDLQLAGWLRFARAKRAGHAREVGRHAADALAARCADGGEVFTGDDVRGILTNLKAAVERQADEARRRLGRGGAGGGRRCGAP